MNDSAAMNRDHTVKCDPLQQHKISILVSLDIAIGQDTSNSKKYDYNDLSENRLNADEIPKPNAKMLGRGRVQQNSI